MKEEYTGFGWADFKQRYEGTYGWYDTEKGNRLLVNLQKVTEDKLSFVDKNNIPYFGYPDKGNVFTFLPVEKGCYQLGDTVVSTTRVPARQWKRGVCPANTSIQDLQSGVILPITFKTLEDIYLPKKNTKLEAFKKYEKVNVAFNQTFALVNDNLYIYRHKIGKMKNNQFVLTNNMFIQEVKDMVKQLGLTTGVVSE